VIDYESARPLDTYSQSNFQKKNNFTNKKITKTIIPQVKKIKDTNKKFINNF